MGFFALLVALMVFVPALGVRIFGVAAAAGMLWLAIRLGKRRLVFDDAGVTAKGVFGTTTMSWDEVDHYTFWSMANHYGYYGGGGQAGLAGALAVAIVVAIVAATSRGNKGTANRRFANGRMTLVGGGKRIVIDLRYKDATAGLDRAFAEVHERLRRRPSCDFSPFQLAATELSHKRKGTLGLPDIEKVGAAGSRIAVRKRGKRLAWAAAPMKSVRNSILFLEQLAEQGVAVTAQDEVFMPPSIVDKLRAAVARQQALPRARVVIRD